MKRIFIFQLIVASDAERSGADWARVESFFSQSYGYFEKKHNISQTIEFFDMYLEQKKIIFGHMIDIRDEQAQPGPTRP